MSTIKALYLATRPYYFGSKGNKSMSHRNPFGSMRALHAKTGMKLKTNSGQTPKLQQEDVSARTYIFTGDVEEIPRILQTFEEGNGNASANLNQAKTAYSNKRSEAIREVTGLDPDLYKEGSLKLTSAQAHAVSAKLASQSFRYWTAQLIIVLDNGDRISSSRRYTINRYSDPRFEYIKGGIPKGKPSEDVKNSLNSSSDNGGEA